jgi:hypothetical protein
MSMPWQDAQAGTAHFLLTRRSVTHPDELAYYFVLLRPTSSYFVFGPADVTLPQLTLVAGTRWQVEQTLSRAFEFEVTAASLQQVFGSKSPNTPPSFLASEGPGGKLRRLQPAPCQRPASAARLGRQAGSPGWVARLGRQAGSPGWVARQAPRGALSQGWRFNKESAHVLRR